MKTLAVLVLFISCFSFLRAQNTIEVPNQIKKHFGSEFTSASTVSWKNFAKTGHYEADFIDGYDYKKAVYSDQGVFLLTETRLAPSQLPLQISRAMSTEFPGFYLEQIRKVETLREVIIKIKIRKKNSRYEVEVDLSGKVKIKRKLPREYEEEDDDDERRHEHKHEHKKKHKHDCDDEDDD